MQRAVGADPVEVAVERDQLAVEAFEGAEAEVAVLAQRPDAHRAFVDPFDERAHGRHLEDRLVLDVEELRERGRDEVAHRLTRLGAALLERVPEPGGDAAAQLVRSHEAPCCQ